MDDLWGTLQLRLPLITQLNKILAQVIQFYKIGETSGLEGIKNIDIIEKWLSIDRLMIPHSLIAIWWLSWLDKILAQVIQFN